MVYVAEVKTAAGVYFRFYETTKLTKRTETVQAVGVKPYNKSSSIEFEVQPDLKSPFVPYSKKKKKKTKTGDRGEKKQKAFNRIESGVLSIIFTCKAS